MDRPSPVVLIARIRQAHSKMVDIFSRGSCWELYLILQEVWPHATAYYDGSHIVTEIDGALYDIHGDVSNKYKNEKLTRLPHPDYRPWEWEGELKL